MKKNQAKRVVHLFFPLLSVFLFAKNSKAADERDLHSLSNPQEVRVYHQDIELHLEGFLSSGEDRETPRERIKAQTGIVVERIDPKASLVLDIRDLKMEEMEVEVCHHKTADVQNSEAAVNSGFFSNSKAFVAYENCHAVKPEDLTFINKEASSIQGQKLVISFDQKDIPAQEVKDANAVKIRYKITPKDRSASNGIVFADGSRTTSGRSFVVTQGKPQLTRDWLPCQDTPGNRFTYTARIYTPKNYLALMSTENPTKKSPVGIYNFKQKVSVPSYLVAFAAGDLAFRSTGDHTGVYAESKVLKNALKEYSSTAKPGFERSGLEEIFTMGESLWGKNPWGRFDLLVGPKNFPYDGIENPRMTVISPHTLLGNRSLQSVPIRMLAHSWVGNSVTPADWNHLWLSDGLATYMEYRLLQKTLGIGQAVMAVRAQIMDAQQRALKIEADDKELLQKGSPVLSPSLTTLHTSIGADVDPQMLMSGISSSKGFLIFWSIADEIQAQFPKSFPTHDLAEDVLDDALADFYNAYRLKSIRSADLTQFLPNSLGEKVMSILPEEAQKMPETQASMGKIIQHLQGPLLFTEVGFEGEAYAPLVKAFEQYAGQISGLNKGAIGLRQIAKNTIAPPSSITLSTYYREFPMMFTSTLYRTALLDSVQEVANTENLKPGRETIDLLYKGLKISKASDLNNWSKWLALTLDSGRFDPSSGSKDMQKMRFFLSHETRKAPLARVHEAIARAVQREKLTKAQAAVFYSYTE